MPKQAPPETFHLMTYALRLTLSILCFAGIPPLFAGIILWNSLPPDLRVSAIFILAGVSGIAIYCAIMVATRLRLELKNRLSEVSQIAAGIHRQTQILVAQRPGLTGKFKRQGIIHN